MFRKESWLQFIGYIFTFLSFFIEIFRSRYLIPLFLMYTFTFFILGKYLYKLLLKLGYNPKKEKEDIKRNIFSFIIFAGIIFLGIYVFVISFLGICHISKIPLTDELSLIKENLLK